MAMLLSCDGSITNTVTSNGYTVECTQPIILVEGNTNMGVSLPISDPQVGALVASIAVLLSVAWLFRLLISFLLNKK